MKKVLLLASVGISGVAAPVVVSCNTQQKNFDFKHKLEELIDIAEGIKFKDKIFLNNVDRAKAILKDDLSSENQIKEAIKKLEVEIDNIYYPGYRDSLNNLISLIESAKEILDEAAKDHNNPKGIRVTKRLFLTLEEALKVSELEKAVYKLDEVAIRLNYLINEFRSFVPKG